MLFYLSAQAVKKLISKCCPFILLHQKLVSFSYDFRYCIAYYINPFFLDLSTLHRILSSADHFQISFAKAKQIFKNKDYENKKYYLLTTL